MLLATPCCVGARCGRATIRRNGADAGGVVEPAARAMLQQEGVKASATLFCGLAVGSVRQWPKVSRERTASL